MESSSSSKQLFLDLPIVFLLLISTAGFFFSNQKPVEAITTESLDYVLYLLRSHGHSLFANGISTSDLLFDVLSLPSLTLLPPSDSALFGLDLTAESPALYLATLRLHVVPFRITDFRNNASLHTLVHSRRRLHVAQNSNGFVLVDGVEVVFPPLYYQSNVAVYALRGMLPPDRLASPASKHKLVPAFPPVMWSDVSLPPAEVESNKPRRFVPPTTAESVNESGEDETDYPEEKDGEEESYSEDYAMQQSHRD